MLFRRRPYTRTERPDMPVDEPRPAGSPRARLELRAIRALLDAQRRRVTAYAEHYGPGLPNPAPPAAPASVPPTCQDVLDALPVAAPAPGPRGR